MKCWTQHHQGCFQLESHLRRVAQTPRIGAFPAWAPPDKKDACGSSVWCTRAGVCVPEDKGRKEKLGGVGTRALSREEKVEIPNGEKGRNL